MKRWPVALCISYLRYLRFQGDLHAAFMQFSGMARLSRLCWVKAHHPPESKTSSTWLHGDMWLQQFRHTSDFPSSRSEDWRIRSKISDVSWTRAARLR